MYTVKCAFLNAVSNKKNSLIILLSLTFGLLLPCLVFGQFYYVECYKDTAGFVSPENTYLLDISGATLFTQEKLDALQDTLGVEKAALLRVVTGLQISRGEKLYTYTEALTPLTEDFLDVKRVAVLRGEFPRSTENVDGKRFCAVNKICAQSYGVSCGDTLLINGQEYTVDAVTVAFDDSFIQRIYLPYDEKIINEERQLQQIVAVQLKSGDNFEDVLFRFRAFCQDYTLNTYEDGAEHSEIYYRESIEMLKGQLKFAVVVLIFSVINIIFVMLGSFERRKRSLAVSLMSGAQFGDVFWQFFTEMFGMLILAEGFLIVLAQVLSKLLYRSIAFGAPVFAACFLLGSVIVTGISVLLSFRMKKLNPCEILRQVL